MRESPAAALAAALAVAGAWALPAAGARAATLKVALLAPEGTTWARNVKAMAREVGEATGGAVGMRLYFGGSQGDEADVLRKIRLGQLHGGVFTGRTLGAISGDARVLELPFTFHKDEAKALRVTRELAPFLEGRLEAKGFASLGLVGLGQVHFVSTRAARGLDDLKGVKIWSWEGDALVGAVLEEMGFVSVPLALPEVLPSLSTGVVEAAYAPPLGVLALQWHTKVGHLIDAPLAWSVGAFLIDKRAWDGLSPGHRKAVRSVGAKFVERINRDNAKDNAEAMEAMRSMGVRFSGLPEKDLARGRALREAVVARLKGSYFSQEAYDRLMGAL